ncbi:MAG: hypothetical protein ACK5PB_03345 [Pirellula sp.]
MKAVTNGAFEMSLANAEFVALVLIAIHQMQELRSSNGTVRWAEPLQMVLFLSLAVTLRF